MQNRHSCFFSQVCHEGKEEGWPLGEADGRGCLSMAVLLTAADSLGDLVATCKSLFLYCLCSVLEPFPGMGNILQHVLIEVWLSFQVSGRRF